MRELQKTAAFALFQALTSLILECCFDVFILAFDQFATDFSMGLDPDAVAVILSTSWPGRSSERPSSRSSSPEQDANASSIPKKRFHCFIRTGCCRWISSPKTHCRIQECRNLWAHYQVVAFEDKNGQKSSDLSPLRHICQRIMSERMSGTLTVPSHFLTVTKAWLINPVIASHLSKYHKLHNLWNLDIHKWGGSGKWSRTHPNSIPDCKSGENREKWSGLACWCSQFCANRQRSLPDSW